MGELSGNDGRVRRSRRFACAYTWLFGKLTRPREERISSVVISKESESAGGMLDVDAFKATSRSWTPSQLMTLEELNRDRQESTFVTYGWTTPDTKFVHDNVEEIEKLLFNGISIFVARPRVPDGSVLSGAGRGDWGWEVFPNIPMTPDMIELAIKDLQRERFKKLRSNYIVIVSYWPEPPKTNFWLGDDLWDTIYNNADLVARVAREGGCEGIMFDPEEYGQIGFWTWSHVKPFPLFKDLSYEEVAAKARIRGRHFMEAINCSYPGVCIWILQSWPLVLNAIGPSRERLPDASHSILLPFLDGMLEASDAQTTFIDGIGNGYFAESFTDFISMGQDVWRNGPTLGTVPDILSKNTGWGWDLFLWI